jgi:hypothetical protein
VFARCSSSDEFGCGDQSVTEGDLFDDLGIVARAAEPLIDDIDEPDMIGTIESGVHQVRSIDVEDHKVLGAAVSAALCHTGIMTKGCDRVLGNRRGTG